MIRTERLVLRPYGLEDLADYLTMVSDAAIARFLGGQPISAEDACNRLLRYAGHWTIFGYGMFAVFERATGRFLGETGIADFHRGLDTAFDHVGEAAWVFASGAQGRGYACEAASAMHRWYADSKDRQRTVCLISPDNKASLTLADKLGYVAFGEVDYRGGPFVMLERTAAR